MLRCAVQAENLPEEVLDKLRLIEPRELRPLAHLTQVWEAACGSAV